jgi:hypothetical protein
MIIEDTLLKGILVLVVILATPTMSLAHAI